MRGTYGPAPPFELTYRVPARAYFHGTTERASAICRTNSWATGSASVSLAGLTDAARGSAQGAAVPGSGRPSWLVVNLGNVPGLQARRSSQRFAIRALI